MSKFATVDAYVDAQSDPMKEVARALVASIDGASLGSRAVWYGHPVWSLGPQPADGPVVYIKAYTRHVTLGFWRGSELKDPRGVLQGEGDRMKHIKITAGTPIDRPGLSAFVKEAVSLNAAKGDPTKG